MRKKCHGCRYEALLEEKKKKEEQNVQSEQFLSRNVCVVTAFIYILIVKIQAESVQTTENQRKH